MSCVIATDFRAGMVLGRHLHPSRENNVVLFLGTEFWDLGHRLFRTTPETYPVKFLAGDVFDNAYLSLTAPMSSGPPPPVASVITLTKLQGRVSVIRASALFHLFSEEKPFGLSKHLAILLDPRPGSIFGLHGGIPVKGQCQPFFLKMFCHSLESWTNEGPVSISAPNSMIPRLDYFCSSPQPAAFALSPCHLAIKHFATAKLTSS